MSSRLGAVLAGLVVLGRAAGAQPVAETAQRPNVVVILTDDQRFDTIGREHSTDGVTPVMRAVTVDLAERGITFTNSFTTTALCAPSRASLLAGRYAHSTGVVDNEGGDALPAFDESRTLAVWLHAAGYVTGLFGKYLNGYEDVAPNVPPGWDEWHAFKKPGYYDYVLVENGVEVPYGHRVEDYSTDVLAARAVAFVREQAAKGPFFVFFTPFAPHEPAIPAPRHEGTFRDVPPWRPPNFDESEVSDKPEWVRAIPPWGPERRSHADAVDRRQLETLQAVDDATGAIMAALREAGVADDTIVVYASDNGYSWGAHRWQMKQCPYEECMRVPLVVVYPRLGTEPRVETRIALNVDYAETLAELARVATSPDVEGRSLVPLIAGGAGPWRTDFLEEHWPKHRLGARRTIPEFAQVRDTRWKYVEYADGQTELYDEASDPWELSNLAADPSRADERTWLAARLRSLRPGWAP